MGDLVDRLDLDDPALWGTIYHGSASEIEMAALALVAELRASRERVATLEGVAERAMHVIGGVWNGPIDTLAESRALAREVYHDLYAALDAPDAQEGNHEQ